jgi:hypothetical protein
MNEITTYNKVYLNALLKNYRARKCIWDHLETIHKTSSTIMSKYSKRTFKKEYYGIVTISGSKENSIF